MAAKATLEIVITDKGSSPVGAPAPDSVRYSGYTGATAAGGTQSGASFTGTAGNVARAAGMVTLASAVVPVASALTDLSTQAKRAAAAEGSAADFITDKIKRLEYSGGGNSAIKIPGSAGHELITAPAGVGQSASGAVEETAAFSVSLGEAAIALGAFAAAAIAAAGTFEKASDVLHSQAEQAAQFSPEVAAAVARSGIAEMMNEMRRAQRIGPELAHFEDVRSKFESKLADLQTQALEVLIKIWEIAEPFAEGVIAFARAIVAVLEPMADGVAVCADVLTLHFATAIEDFKKMLVDLGKIPGAIKDAMDPAPENPLVDPFASDLAAMAHPPMRRIHGHPMPMGI